MRFSIITASFNHAAFIQRNIESVLGQDYPDFEHIVVDDGSQDGTLDILRSYPHLRWVSQVNQGQSHAVNRGFTMATGDILGWLDSDDTYLPGAFRAVKPYFEGDPDLGMIYGYCEMIDEYDRVIARYRSRPWDLQRLIRASTGYVANQTVFLRRQVYESVGQLDEGLHFAMDREYWIRVGLQFKVQRVPHFLAAHRHHRAAKTFSGDPRISQEREAIRRKYRSEARPAEWLWATYYDARSRLYQVKSHIVQAVRRAAR